MFNNEITPNRLAKFFPVDPPPVAELPRQSTADKLLCGAWTAKIELTRFADDEDCSCEVEIRSTIEGNPAEVLADLLRTFRTPRTEGGAA